MKLRSLRIEEAADTKRMKCCKIPIVLNFICRILDFKGSPSSVLRKDLEIKTNLLAMSTSSTETIVSKYCSSLKGQNILRKMLNLGLERDGLKNALVCCTGTIDKEGLVIRSKIWLRSGQQEDILITGNGKYWDGSKHVFQSMSS